MYSLELEPLVTALRMPCCAPAPEEDPPTAAEFWPPVAAARAGTIGIWANWAGVA